MPHRKPWSPSEIDELVKRFPHEPTASIATAFDRTLPAVNALAYSLGLRKSAAFISDCRRSGRLNATRGKDTRFKPGHKTSNTGLKGFNAGGRSVETRFKPGRPAAEATNYLPLGSYRVSSYGYLDLKVTDDRSIAPSRRWVAVHRLVWEAAHGPVPAGHAVAFRPGRRTTDLEQITLDAVELVSRAELMRRNSRHNLPPELSALIQMRAVLTRKIRKKTKAHEEQNAARP